MTGPVVAMKTLPPQDDNEELITDLDKKSDVNGFKSVSEDTGDWTDVKHSERKKRDRILPDGVVMKLMKKSDYYGFKRLLSNLSLLFLTSYAILKLDVYPLDINKLTLQQMLVFVPLYVFYGFQMQCLAFAGGHELVHGNALKRNGSTTLLHFV